MSIPKMAKAMGYIDDDLVHIRRFTEYFQKPAGRRSVSGAVRFHYDGPGFFSAENVPHDLRGDSRVDFQN